MSEGLTDAELRWALDGLELHVTIGRDHEMAAAVPWPTGIVTSEWLAQALMTFAGAVRKMDEDDHGG